MKPIIKISPRNRPTKWQALAGIIIWSVIGFGVYKLINYLL